jgi:hypothetical protein
MALVVVGGQTKHVGKTTLICNLIRRFSSARWIAVKFTPHSHHPDNCKLIARGPEWSIWEQLPGSQTGDTARFLQAGALRSLMVISEAQFSSEACSRLQLEFAHGRDIIAESSSAALLLKPDLSLMMIDFCNEDFKASAKAHQQIADALIVRGEASEGVADLTAKMGIPVFPSLPDSLDPALALLVESAIVRKAC